MDYLADIKPETLDSLYASHLVSLRDVILQLDNANYIELCKNWIQRFNKASFKEKVSRNCLLSLLSEQLKKDRYLSAPFTAGNYNKNLNEIFESVGTSGSEKTLSSNNTRTEELTSSKLDASSPLSLRKIAKHVSECITEPNFKTVSDRIAEWIPDKNSSLEQDVATFCSDSCGLPINRAQLSPSNTDDLSAKLQDLNKIVFHLKDQNHNLKLEVEAINGKHQQLENKLKEKNEKLDEMEEKVAYYKNLKDNPQLDSNLVNNTLRCLMEQFNEFVKGNCYEQVLTENSFQIFSNLFNAIFPNINNNLASILGFHDTQFKNLLVEMVKRKVDEDQIEQQNLEINHLKKCLKTTKMSRDTMIASYEKKIKKLVDKQKIEYRLLRLKMITVVSTLLLKSNQKQEDEFIKIINSVDNNYKSIINKYFQTKLIKSMDSNVLTRL